jgi:hypothetical protein
MASLMVVLRSEWMLMPRPPCRSGSMPVARQYFLTSLTSCQGVLRSRCRHSSPVLSGYIGRSRGPSLSFGTQALLHVGDFLSKENFICFT